MEKNRDDKRNIIKTGSIYGERSVRNVIELIKQYRLYLLATQETKIKFTGITNVNGHVF